MVSPSIVTHEAVVCPPPRDWWLLFHFLHPQPRPCVWVYPCSTRKGSDKLSGHPWQCRAKTYIACMRIHTHIHAQTFTFTTWAGLLAQGWWWRWAWGWHVSANNHITHTGTHIPTSWSTPPPPSSHLSVSLGYLYNPPPPTGLVRAAVV